MTRAALDLDELYLRHGRSLLSWFARRTADTETALDLWAETFAQAVVGRRRYRGRTDAEAAGWLWGIARRQLARYHRRGAAEQRALRRLGLERPPADDAVIAEIEREAALVDLRRELDEALVVLSRAGREAVELRVVRGLPYPEVARRLGITEPAARARVSRSLHALAQTLERPSIGEMS